MTRAATVTQSDLARALRAAADAGLPVAEIVMTPRQVRLVLAKPPESPKGPMPKEWPSE